MNEKEYELIKMYCKAQNEERTTLEKIGHIGLSFSLIKHGLECIAGIIFIIAFLIGFILYVCFKPIPKSERANDPVFITEEHEIDKSNEMYDNFYRREVNENE